MKEHEGYTPQEAQEGRRDNGKEQTEIKHPVDLEKMWSNIRSGLRLEITDPKEAERAFADIERALETSDSLADFVDKFKNLFSSENYRQLGPRAPERDRAFINLQSTMLSNFSQYFAAKEGYKDHDQYLRERHGAERIKE